jgi:hypothetical protein
MLMPRKRTFGSALLTALVAASFLSFKPGDSVTLVFNRQEKALQAVQVASYLTDPSDAVTISVQFAKLPDGTNHVSTNQVTGVSKQLGVMVQNSSYQPIG